MATQQEPLIRAGYHVNKLKLHLMIEEDAVTETTPEVELSEVVETSPREEE